LGNFLDHALRRVSDEGKVGIKLMDAYDEVEYKKQLKRSNINLLEEYRQKALMNY
jgi:hypothetical protein